MSDKSEPNTIDSEDEPLLIGITGGMGSGKSTVAEVFENAGFPVINADAEAKLLMQSNQDIKAQLIHTFGNTIFASDGTLQTKELSDLVFNSTDTSNLARLNAIVHPPLLDTLFTKAEELAHDHDMVIIDIALLYETGLEQGFDYIIGVTSEDHLRFDRIEKRSGLTKEEISKRIQAQISQEELIQKADFIIENNGSKEELIDATECILAFLPYLPNTIHDDESE